MNDQTVHPAIDQMSGEAENRQKQNQSIVGGALQRYQQHGPLVALLNRKEHGIVRNSLVQELQQGFEYRRQSLQMVLDTRLQSMEEMCNQVLVTGKARLRQQRSRFFAEELFNVQQAMNAIAVRFNDEVGNALEALKRIEHERLRAREEERIFHAYELFHDTIDKLTTNFANIINESVTR
ncbi:MAG: hypothetical protein KDG50_14450 [Chromatiales bacterium]|nr:hypothetical protein [Chromatiales bacterium]